MGALPQPQVLGFRVPPHAQVQWDAAAMKGIERAGDVEAVNPWELQTDPEELRERELEARRAAEATKKAARTIRGARRKCAPSPQDTPCTRRGL